MAFDSVDKNEVFVFHQPIELDRPLLPGCEIFDFLTSDEITQGEQFKLKSKRYEFLLSRALIRKSLSTVYPVEPFDWKFSTNEFGRPDVLLSDKMGPISFNLSHTRGLIICAINFGSELGVDVEEIKPHDDLIAIAKTHFSHMEFKHISNFSGEDQTREFFKIWTLKEAYIKGRGMGLSIPLKDFAFNLKDINEILFTTKQGLDPHSSLWRFVILNLDSNYQLAVALRNNLFSPIKLTHIHFNLNQASEIEKPQAA